MSLSDLPVDTTLYSLFLIVSLTIGALAARRVRSLEDYYVAGATVPWYLLCGTFIASNVSAGLFLGGTDMTGRHGYTLWCSFFSTTIGYVFAIGVVGVLVKRLASKHEVYDFADIFAVRYPSRKNEIRVLIAILLPLLYIPALAAQFMALAAISASLFGMSYEPVLMLVVAIVIVYTILGGMLGVVWTDAFQFVVLMVGLILAVPLGMAAVGGGDPTAGWQRLVDLSPELFNWSTDAFPWQAVLGQMVWMFALASQPHLVTRFLTAKDERTIIKALPVCAIAALIIYACTVPVGLLGRLSPTGGAEDHYYIALARNTLGPWLGTFVLIGVAAAALSTSSTVLMVTAQAISRDLYQRWRGGNVSETHMVLVSRISVLLAGLLAAVIAYYQVLEIFWLIVLSGSLFVGIFFVPLVFGFFSTRASGTAALAAMISGGIATISVYTINKSTGQQWFISEYIAGLLFSTIAWVWFTRRSPASADERAVIQALASPDER